MLLAAVGAGWCFFLNGISFLAVIFSLFIMRFPPVVPRPGIKKPGREILEGLSYVRGRRDILGILGLTLAFGVIGSAYSSQLPAFVSKQLHADETVFGVINTAIGLGALCGGIILAQFSTRLPRGKLVAGAAIIYPVVLGVFAFVPNLTLSLILAFLLGLGFLMLFNNFNSLLQLNSSDHMRGRVMSIYSLIFFGLAPFGSLLMGTVASWLPLSTTIGLSAVLTLLMALAVLLSAPEVSKL